MQYEKPAISDLGSITDHTFGYRGKKKKRKGKGDNAVAELFTSNHFDEPSHS